MEDDIKWKTNSNIKSETTTGQILPNFFLTKPNFTNVSNEDNLQWMTTSNIKSEISQQNPVGSSSNRKRKFS